MKNLKTSKIIQIILLTLVLAVVAIIIVGVSTNSNVMATVEKCPKCNKGDLIACNMTDTTHGWVCNNEDCGYKYSGEEHNFEIVKAEGISGKTKHKYVKKCIECYHQVEGEEYCTDLLEQYTDIGDGKHKAICSACKTWYELEHQNDKNGDCKLCGAHAENDDDDGKCPKCNKGDLIACNLTDTTHGWVCNNEDCDYQYNGEEHHFEIIKAEGISGKIKHKYVKKCIQCSHKVEGEEYCTDLLEQYTDIGKGKHKAICSGCKTWYELEHQNDKNGDCKLCGAHTDENQEIEITSNKYEINDKYISKVQAETTVNKFKENIETNATEVKIYKGANLVSNSEKIGTGMKVQLKLENKTEEFIVIVSGDADGNGSIGLPDMSTANRHRLNKKKLEEIYILAADVTGDGNIDVKDLTKINKFRLNKITEL